MAFTYDVSQLSENSLFQVRFRLGDITQENHTFEDEELQYLLTFNGNNVLAACIASVSALLPRLAGGRKFTVGPYSEDQSSAAYDYWSRMLEELKAQQTLYSAPVAELPKTPSYFYYGMMGTPESSATDP